MRSDSSSPRYIRLNRYLALSGICSRRKAIQHIVNQQVTVNGKTVTEPAFQVDTQKDRVTFKGKRIFPERPTYILLNKPKNTLTTLYDPHHRPTILDYLKDAPKVRLFPVGRLDRNTTGILLLTNDGDLTKKLLHPSTKVPRIYRAKVDQAITHEALDKLLRGFYLEEGFAQADAVHKIDAASLEITVHVGYKHMIRRMLAYVGFQVKALDRIAFGPITRKGVPRGKWRFLTPQEIGWLKMLAPCP
ncbi:MAG: pseudouridine synthase [Bacteroidia bacterium]